MWALGCGSHNVRVIGTASAHTGLSWFSLDGRDLARDYGPEHSFPIALFLFESGSYA